jgi:hypothetical protein
VGGDDRGDDDAFDRGARRDHGEYEHLVSVRRVLATLELVEPETHAWLCVVCRGDDLLPHLLVVREATSVERIAYTRTQAAEALGVSRSTFDRRVLPLLETVETPWGTRLVPVDELTRLLGERRHQLEKKLRRLRRGGLRPWHPKSSVGSAPNTLPARASARSQAQRRRDTDGARRYAVVAVNCGRGGSPVSSLTLVAPRTPHSPSAEERRTRIAASARRSGHGADLPKRALPRHLRLARVRPLWPVRVGCRRASI